MLEVEQAPLDQFVDDCKLPITARRSFEDGDTRIEAREEESLLKDQADSKSALPLQAQVKDTEQRRRGKIPMIKPLLTFPPSPVPAKNESYAPLHCGECMSSLAPSLFPCKIVEQRSWSTKQQRLLPVKKACRQLSLLLEQTRDHFSIDAAAAKITITAPQDRQHSKAINRCRYSRHLDVQPV